MANDKNFDNFHGWAFWINFRAGFCNVYFNSAYLSAYVTGKMLGTNGYENSKIVDSDLVILIAQ